MAKQLCKSHITQLCKVGWKLAYKQKMDGTQLILGAKNQKRMKKAEQLISKAIKQLSEIK